MKQYKLAIRYKDKIYIRVFDGISILLDKINSSLHLLNIPLHITVFEKQLDDQSIYELMEYQRNKENFIEHALPKPDIKFNEFKIKEEN